MTQVTVDAQMIASLKGLSGPLEFWDEQGNLLGRFEPDERSPTVRAWLKNLDPELTTEEIDRRAERAHQAGLTTEQVLRRLQAQDQ